MNAYRFTLSGAEFDARASKALWWAEMGLLCVSDLHLGKSERIARRGGALLPPYETRDTLQRLDDEISALNPKTVVCLGDSFDDLDASLSLSEDIRLWLTRLMAGRTWIWVEGNHDPGPIDLGGQHHAAFRQGSITFRHIADPNQGDISGHYHPKASLRLGGSHITRPCFLVDGARAILPAFGTYTGGLNWSDPVFQGLMGRDALAVLTGARAHAFPMFSRPKVSRP